VPNPAAQIREIWTPILKRPINNDAARNRRILDKNGEADLTIFAAASDMQSSA
jgi:hypothetical protein